MPAPRESRKRILAEKMAERILLAWNAVKLSICSSAYVCAKLTPSCCYPPLAASQSCNTSSLDILAKKEEDHEEHQLSALISPRKLGSQTRQQNSNQKKFSENQRPTPMTKHYSMTAGRRMRQEKQINKKRRHRKEDKEGKRGMVRKREIEREDWRRRKLP